MDDNLKKLLIMGTDTFAMRDNPNISEAEKVAFAKTVLNNVMSAHIAGLRNKAGYKPAVLPEEERIKTHDERMDAVLQAYVDVINQHSHIQFTVSTLIKTYRRPNAIWSALMFFKKLTKQEAVRERKELEDRLLKWMNAEGNAEGNE